MLLRYQEYLKRCRFILRLAWKTRGKTAIWLTMKNKRIIWDNKHLFEMIEKPLVEISKYFWILLDFTIHGFDDINMLETQW